MQRGLDSWTRAVSGRNALPQRFASNQRTQGVGAGTPTALSGKTLVSAGLTHVVSIDQAGNARPAGDPTQKTSVGTSSLDTYVAIAHASRKNYRAARIAGRTRTGSIRKARDGSAVHDHRPATGGVGCWGVPAALPRTTGSDGTFHPGRIIEQSSSIHSPEPATASCEPNAGDLGAIVPLFPSLYLHCPFNVHQATVPF